MIVPFDVNRHRWSVTRDTLRCVLLLSLTMVVMLLGCSARPPSPVPCVERAVFGDPAQSPYILPYPPGTSYELIQAYCYPYGGHRDQLAYDFRMPIGHDVTAARAGVVRRLRDDLSDTGTEQNAGQHNHILIEHADGTVALYGHLKQRSVAVEVGQRMVGGQRLAASGNSGNTLGVPHLHFGVYQSWPATEGFDVPVNFRNAHGPLDGRGGLVPHKTYEALGYRGAEATAW